MVNYICNRCLKSFSQKSHYQKHLIRKYLCQYINNSIKDIVKKVINKELNTPVLLNQTINKELNILEKSKTIKIKIMNEKNINNIDIIEKSKTLNKFNFIDLFCGIGGFHTALRKMGHTCVMACDIDNNCRNVYEKNYGIKPLTDIREIDEMKITPFDILTGGFPCQTFSNAGKKKD